MGGFSTTSRIYKREWRPSHRNCPALLYVCLQCNKNAFSIAICASANNMHYIFGSFFRSFIRPSVSVCRPKHGFAYVTGINISVLSGGIYILIIPILCVDSRNVERPERRPTVLTTMSDCQAIVSRIVRVGIAATYCHFRWPAFRSVGIKAVTGYTRECSMLT